MKRPAPTVLSECCARENGLDVRWEDGESSFFHWIWLRDNDPGQKLASGQRLFETSSLLRDINAFRPPRCSQITEAGDLKVEWDESTVSEFSASWLLNHSYAEQHVRARLAQVSPMPWTAALRYNLPYIKWDAVEHSSTGKLQALQCMERLGFCIITGAGAAERTVLRVAARFGQVRRTNYGELFDVRVKPGCSNLADSSKGLSCHTDNPYRDPTPGVQLLHCLRPAGDGSGETVLVDGFAAAQRLREQQPDAFRLLTTCPQPYRYVEAAEQVDLRAAHPIISLDTRKNVTSIQLNNRSAAPLELPAEQVEPYYRALGALWAEIESPDLQITFPLKEGEVVMFHNNRVLHGRSAFTAGHARHLQGCYVDKDALQSATRALSAEIEPSPPSPFSLTVQNILKVLETGAAEMYGEALDTLQHSLQAAHCARHAGEADEVVVAALCHDVGHLEACVRQLSVAAGGSDAPQKMLASGEELEAGTSVGYEGHERLGAQFMLQCGFPGVVAELINGHVEAKRYLVRAKPSYMASLSAASLETLKCQGGPMSDSEV
ncbi:hypothetical protein CYMTET_47976, partial [Cymbomonas tetramitiformis]